MPGLEPKPFTFGARFVESTRTCIAGRSTSATTIISPHSALLRLV